MPYIKAKPTTADAVCGDACQLLAALDSRQWRALESLATAHTSGSISLQAWRAASSAVVFAALERVQNEGRLALAEA